MDVERATAIHLEWIVYIPTFNSKLNVAQLILYIYISTKISISMKSNNIDKYKIKVRSSINPSIYPLVNQQFAIENDHRNRGFSHWKWWFSLIFHSYVSLPEGIASSEHHVLHLSWRSPRSVWLPWELRDLKVVARVGGDAWGESYIYIYKICIIYDNIYIYIYIYVT